MGYFKIKMSTNTKEIGRSYPQVCRFENGANYDRDSPSSIYNVGAWGSIATDLLIPNYELEYFSKRTDLLSVAVHNSSIFLLMSERLFEFILEFDVPEYKAFATKTIARNKSYEYYLFHMPPMAIHIEMLDESKVRYDIFRMARPITGYFVSSKLKIAIEEAGFTGVEFIPFEKVKGEIINSIG